jgi:hypothetical protein
MFKTTLQEFETLESFVVNLLALVSGFAFMIETEIICY